jgi:hypothetical protein
MVPHILLLLLLNPHIRKTFYSDLLQILKTCIPTSAIYTKYSIPTYY